MPIPPLANVASFEEAAEIGFSVDETVERLMRYAWIAKRTMEVALYWINPTPEWEVKEALSLHCYLAADHAQAFRVRVSEMRNPMPDMDKSPDPRLDRLFDEVLTARSTSEKLTALYSVLKPALLAAYEKHYGTANPLVDHPTRRILRLLILEEQDAVTWGSAAVAAVGEAATFKAHLEQYLIAAGGIDGFASIPEALPASRVIDTFQPDFYPRRDERFALRGNFIFPPHEVARTESVSADERTLALMCKRALEMDVPEAMARMIVEAKGQPWLFYVDMCRQLWDEARHAMMGSVYFEHLGIDWKRDIALHPGFSLRLNLHMTANEAHAALYTIEQNLMPATTGKKYEWETASQAADSLAQLFQDFDWADEVLHVRIGRDWGIPKSGMNRQEFQELGARRLVETEAVLEQYAQADQQVNWWGTFVDRVLGHESGVKDQGFGTSDPVYSKRS
jgi:hypothetical protein